MAGAGHFALPDGFSGRIKLHDLSASRREGCQKSPARQKLDPAPAARSVSRIDFPNNLSLLRVEFQNDARIGDAKDIAAGEFLSTENEMAGTEGENFFPVPGHFQQLVVRGNKGISVGKPLAGDG